MPQISPCNRLAVVLAVRTVSVGTAGFTLPARAEESPAMQKSTSSRHATSPAKPKLDVSGHKRVGEASFYSCYFGSFGGLGSFKGQFAS